MVPMASTADRAFTPDWSRARDRVATHNWAGKIWEALITETGRWRGQLVIAGPDEVSAWTHHYFCDDDGTRLTFDPALPHEHRCATCGRVYDDELRIGAWRTTHHNAAAAQTQRNAIIMRVATDEELIAAARTELQTIVTTYGNSYAAYPKHGFHAGIGKVTPQCLDEAIWAISLLRSVRWTADLLDEATLEAAAKIAHGVVELLRPQVTQIHNIHSWMLGALAEAARRLGDDELLTWTANSEFGAIAQLDKGFHPEGLWFEVNPHYHYYTVDALLAWVEAYGPASIPTQQMDILRRAVMAPPQLAYTDGRIPAYGDGWPDTPVTAFARHAEKALGLLGVEGIDLSVFVPRGARREGEAALLFGPTEVSTGDTRTPGSLYWKGSGIALLRSPAARIVIRCGPHAGGHDHNDKLAVDLETSGGWCSMDLGTSGYGAEFTTWMRSPGAHSTVFVGGRAQPASDGAITSFDDRRAVGEVSWDGVRMKRSLELGDREWSDVVEVDLDRADEITWIFHGDGKVITVPPRSAATLPAELTESGLNWLTDFGALTSEDGRIYVTWNRRGAPDAVIQLPPGFRCWAGEGPGNPNGLPLGTVVVSGYAQSASFAARFSLS